MRAKFACGHVQGHARSHVTSINVKVIHGQMVMITPGTSHSKDMQQSIVSFTVDNVVSIAIVKVNTVCQGLSHM